MAKKKKKSVLILKNPLDFTLLITVFILLGLGITTVLSASSPNKYTTKFPKQETVINM
jgi:cell division protein FtsW (lipid II flippase)